MVPHPPFEHAWTRAKRVFAEKTRFVRDFHAKPTTKHSPPQARGGGNNVEADRQDQQEDGHRNDLPFF
jgi:hypothetical protein